MHGRAHRWDKMGDRSVLHTPILIFTSAMKKDRQGTPCGRPSEEAL